MSADWQAAWQAVIHHPLFAFGLTLGSYQLAMAAYERTRWGVPAAGTGVHGAGDRQPVAAGYRL